jgi:hypothetical protein
VLGDGHSIAIDASHGERLSDRANKSVKRNPPEPPPRNRPPEPYGPGDDEEPWKKGEHIFRAETRFPCIACLELQFGRGLLCLPGRQ